MKMILYSLVSVRQCVTEHVYFDISDEAGKSISYDLFNVSWWKFYRANQQFSVISDLICDEVDDTIDDDYIVPSIVLTMPNSSDTVSP